MPEPIRVLNMFTIMDRGGAETMVMNYYRNMDRTRVQFDFLVHRQQRGAYDDEIEALGGRIYRLSPIYPQNFGKYKREISAFFKAHPEYRIIHSHMSELGYFAFQEAHRQGVPVRVCHAHNAPTNFDAKMIVRTYFKKRMMPHVTDLFMCGEKSGIWLYGKKNRDRFVMMNNAIDAAAYRADETVRQAVRSELGVEDEVVLGHVGRFNEQKNHPFLIDLFAEAVKKEPRVRLVLVGDGEGRAAIEKKVQTLGLTDKVLFLGVRSDVPRLLQAMDVFVFPSLYEGLPLSILEVQANGLPCVISDRVPEDVFLTDLIQPLSLGDPKEVWIEKILSVKRSQPQAYNDCLRGSDYAVETAMEKIYHIYERLL